MTVRKKQIRQQFRDAVFKRDGYRCVVCGFKSTPEKAEQELDAHHITPRDEMPNGGYVKENGVTLCDQTKGGRRGLRPSCHFQAESVLRYPTTCILSPKYTAEALYKAIGSSREEAEQASENMET